MSVMSRRRSASVDTYLDELRALGKSEHTIAAYRSVLHAWRASGDPPQQFLLDLARRGKAPATVNQRRAILSAYHAWLVGRGEAKQNPLLHTQPANTPKRLRRTLSVAEVARLIEACSFLGTDRQPGHIEVLGHLSMEAYRARLAAMIAVQVTAGLRVSEVCNLRVDAVDLRARTARVIGKGDKERQVRFGMVAKRKIEAWLPHRETLPGHVLFCARNGNPVLARSYHRQLDEACRWADLPSIRPHLLRHTFATMAIDAGVPAADVQQMLGHDQVTTTMLYVQRAAGRGWDRYDRHPLEAEGQGDD